MGIWEKQIAWSLGGPRMEFDFYTVCDGEPFEYFQQKHNMICLIF